MSKYQKHLLLSGTSITEALKRLNKLAKDAITFVVDEQQRLIGSLTDGDIRRGLLKGVEISQAVDDIIQPNPKFLRKGERDIQKVIEYRRQHFRILPVLDKHDVVVNVINFGELKSYLPIDVVVMAGGKGTRLRPLTENTPKPLLPVGNVPILEHNLNRLCLFGMDDYWFSVNYLGEQVEAYFGNGNDRNVHIDYVWEDKPLGTIGAVSKIKNFTHDYVLITNSDVLTDLNYEHLFVYFLEHGADFAVVTIPYKVDIPYAVLETKEGRVTDFREKPTYTYYSNGGIYLMKRSVLAHLPENAFYNTTDLMEDLIKKEYKVVSYPLNGYWLDVGKHEDYKQAQKDIKRINLF
jgi:dTDP-glucose pyrophosphorylase